MSLKQPSCQPCSTVLKLQTAMLLQDFLFFKMKEMRGTGLSKKPDSPAGGTANKRMC